MRTDGLLGDSLMCGEGRSVLAFTLCFELLCFLGLFAHARGIAFETWCVLRMIPHRPRLILSLTAHNSQNGSYSCYLLTHTGHLNLQ